MYVLSSYKACEFLTSTVFICTCLIVPSMSF